MTPEERLRTNVLVAGYLAAGMSDDMALQKGREMAERIDRALPRGAEGGGGNATQRLRIYNDAPALRAYVRKLASGNVSLSHAIGIVDSWDKAEREDDAAASPTPPEKRCEACNDDGKQCDWCGTGTTQAAEVCEHRWHQLGSGTKVCRRCGETIAPAAVAPPAEVADLSDLEACRVGSHQAKVRAAGGCGKYFWGITCQKAANHEGQLCDFDEGDDAPAAVAPAATTAKCARCGKAAISATFLGCRRCYDEWRASDDLEDKFPAWARANPIAVEPRAEAPKLSVYARYEQALARIAALESAAKAAEPLAEIGRAVVTWRKDETGGRDRLWHAVEAAIGTYLASKPAPPGEGKP